MKEETFGYTGIEMLTLRVVERTDIERDFPADPTGFVSEMCRLIEKECHLTGQFHRLAGLVKDYIQQVLFGVFVDMEEDFVLIRLNKPDAKTAIFGAFVESIRQRTIQPQTVRPTGEVLRLSDTPGFPWSRKAYAGEKTVFNLVACDVQFEADFAAFLDRARDVAAYVKNNQSTYFSLDYQSSQGAVRYYYPDFLVRLVSGDMFLVETKGLEDAEVPFKDARANQWAQDMRNLTGVGWFFHKVPYALFQASSAKTFQDLLRELST